MHKKDRRSQHVKPLCYSAFRKFLRGRTYNQTEEARGRKRSLGPRAVAALNKKRRELVKKADGEQEVTWDECIKKSRVRKVHRTTAKRALNDAGIPVARRRPREKPQRNSDNIATRKEVCRRWRFLPDDYFSEQVDLIIDNSHVEVPTTKSGRTYKNKMKVRFQNRTPQEGLEPEYTKPNKKKHRKPLGATLSVCAGIRKNRVVLWEYLDQRWDADAAEKLYRGPIAKVLRRVAADKAQPTILEDNDPTGYKSNKAKRAKKQLGIRVVSLPPYSPDLNPCDFFLWNSIESRMQKCDPKSAGETVEQYKKRLRKIALATPPRVLGKAVASIKKRAHAIYNADGGNIRFD